MDRTPVKRKSFDESTAPLFTSSSKFLKPCNVGSAPCQRRGLRRASYFHKEEEDETNSSPTAVRRAQLQLETVIAEGQYSPLKFTRFLQKSQTTRAPNQITFSPLMKKLQRSPSRNSISFPVVKRSASKVLTPTATIKSPTKQQASKSFSRVLNFSEDTVFPDRSLSVTGDGKTTNIKRPRAGSVSGSEQFYPLNTPCIDWSLKTRIRFACNRQLPFHGMFKTVDEASGLNGFVRGEASTSSIPSSMTSRLFNFSDLQSTSSSNDNFSAELYRNTLVWQHPDVPWVKPFPRTPKVRPGASLTSNQSSPPFIITPDGVIADEMYSHFCQSFHSLFKLFRSKQCPYFYLCANEYTVVFRASGLVGCEDAQALITPTSNGFRKLLEKEGLEYTMPFHPKRTTGSPTTNSSSSLVENLVSSSNESGLGTSIDSINEREGEEKQIEEEDLEDLEPLDIDLEAPGGGNAEWLESLGLSQQDFPSLESSQIRRKQLLNQRKRLDDQTAEGRMKSLVKIVGVPNCQALMGMLINNRKICVSSSGPLAGIPPTLLSPVAFLGATLKAMSIKQASSVIAANGGTHLTTIDIVGPILPNNVFGLMNLFGRYCQPQSNGSPFTVVKSHLTTYDQSASFAIETGLQSTEESCDGNAIDMQLNPTFSVENLEGSGLDRRFLTAICTPSRQVATPLSLFELAPSGIRYNRKQK